jgi:hypothetical protein
MKRILQTLDGVSSKSVEGADSMSRFLRIVEGAEQVPPMPDITGLQAGQPKDLGDGSKVTLNQDGTVAYQGGWGTYTYNAQGQHISTQSPSFAGYSQQTDASGKVTQQNYNQGPMNIQKGPQGTAANYQLGDKNLTTQINEGSSPHKVSLPVQMAMQHYQANDSTAVERKPTIRTGIRKYYKDVEQDIQEQQTSKRQLINQYASTIAERVLMRESKQDSLEASAKRAAIKDLMDKDIYADHNKADNFKGTDGKKHNKSKYMSEKQVAENEIPDHSMGFTGGAGPGIQSAVAEAPLDFDKENPVASTIHSHQGVNPASVEARIMRARGQLRDLAAKAESNELLVWESIARHFPELAMNIEQIRHGIEELAKIRKMGGRRTGNIPKDIGEEISIKEANAKKRTLKNSNPCWKGYHPVGTKQKGGNTVPNCVPKE